MFHFFAHVFIVSYNITVGIIEPDKQIFNLDIWYFYHGLSYANDIYNSSLLVNYCFCCIKFISQLFLHPVLFLGWRL